MALEGRSSGSGAGSKPAAAGSDTSAAAAGSDTSAACPRCARLEAELVLERQTRARLQHELRLAADGRPFDPEVR